MADQGAGQAAGAPTGEEIAVFAADWYRKLDEHVPGPEITPLVLDRGLEFVVPEATLRSRQEFGDWYAGGGGHPGVINLFFDEVHTLSLVEATSNGQRARVKVVVNWQARRWTAPAAAKPVDRLRRVSDMGNRPVAGNGETGDCPLRGGRTPADAGITAALNDMSRVGSATRQMNTLGG